MKITVKGFISVEKKSWDKENPYRWFWRGESSRGLFAEKLGETIIADYDINIEAPDNLDELIHAGTLKFLQHQRTLILAENEVKLQDIDRKISELLAIENKADNPA